MTNTLDIFSVLNKKYAISQEDAMQIFPSLEYAISEQHPVELSFVGIENCSTIFLNNSLGKLYLAFGDKVDEFVHFTGISSDDPVLPERLERLRRRALNPEIYKPIFETAIGKA